METQYDRITVLNELNDELEDFFRSTPVPQLFVDAQFILRKFTPPCMKQLGLKSTDVGRPVANIKRKFRLRAIISDIRKVMDSGEILEKEIQTTDTRCYHKKKLFRSSKCCWIGSRIVSKTL